MEGFTVQQVCSITHLNYVIVYKTIENMLRLLLEICVRKFLVQSQKLDNIGESFH